MLDITQEDFIPAYMNVRAGGQTYPKIISWVTESPVIEDNLQITVSILQRQMDPEWDWEFIPSLKVSDALSMDSEEDYITKQYEDDSDITLDVEWTFDEAIGAVSDKVAELKYKYAG